MNDRILASVSNYKHIIWDWNGTLVDDVDVAVGAVNVLLTENGLKPLSSEEYRAAFGFPVRKYYENLGFDFSKVTFEQLCDRFIDEYNVKRAALAQLFPGTLDLLAQVRVNRKQSILSAASQWHLDEITTHFDIRHFFDHVFGVGDHFASSKVDRGHELVRASGIAGRDTLLIGDTDHDCEVAREIGVDCLLISDGHQTHDRLIALHDNVIFGRRT